MAEAKIKTEKRAEHDYHWSEEIDYAVGVTLELTIDEARSLKAALAHCHGGFETPAGDLAAILGALAPYSLGDYGGPEEAPKVSGEIRFDDGEYYIWNECLPGIYRNGVKYDPARELPPKYHKGELVRVRPGLREGIFRSKYGGAMMGVTEEMVALSASKAILEVQSGPFRYSTNDKVNVVLAGGWYWLPDMIETYVSVVGTLEN